MAGSFSLLERQLKCQLPLKAFQGHPSKVETPTSSYLLPNFLFNKQTSYIYLLVCFVFQGLD